MLYLCTGFTKNYTSTAKNRILETMKRNANVPCFCLTVDFNEEEEHLKRDYPEIDFHQVSSDHPARCASYSMQHGSFTEQVPYNDDDVIIFVDADIDMQRPLKVEEIRLWSDFKNMDWSMSYNDNYWDTLEAEYNRIGPNKPKEYYKTYFPGDWSKMPCYNGGVIVANKATYRQMFKDFQLTWDQTAPYFSNAAIQQWTMGYCVNNRGYNFTLLPPDVHVHLKYRVLKPTRLVNGTMMHDNSPVLFYHWAPCNPYIEG